MLSMVENCFTELNEFNDFLNNHKANVFANGDNPIHLSTLDESQRAVAFSQLVDHTITDTTAYPVIVFSYENEYVAWFDVTKCEGYVDECYLIK